MWYNADMTWQQKFNSLFTDSFFRFLFGFTIIIAMSFAIVVTTDALFGGEQGKGQSAIVAQ